MGATSSYSDNTTAAQIGEWKLIIYNPGYEYQGDPDDLTANQRRAHDVFQRVRTLKGDSTTPIGYSSQEGQIGTIQDKYTNGFGAKIGGTYYGPGGPADKGFICTDDWIEPVTQRGEGFEAVQQVQIWEYWGSWADWDETLLYGSSSTTTTTTGA